MIANLLQNLLAGQYICPVAFQDDFDKLEKASVRSEVNAWLAKLDMRLARLSDTGAYFMARSVIAAQHCSAVKEDLLKYRDVYGPILLMLNHIRQAKTEGLEFSPGERIQIAELETGIIENASLAAQLRQLYGVIKGITRDATNRTYLKRMMEHLREDGFVVLSNAQTESYQFTGKIDHIHAVLEFISEHEAIVGLEVDDQAHDGDTGDLFATAELSHD